ncbi:uncharacterized protein [Spinacia oleracea]|uniref:DUF4218 domain-containing protein n=1 Tax=Spinacia oleracea TaxID=3562 RepID=A0ABM3QQE9_SPIOL|nr:uncharacterized protein LOC110792194 [Spinacia oleracea]
MSKEGKKLFYEVLENVKFPDGYASNISRCGQKHRSLSGLKSHDCHVLMQCVLPIALRRNLDDKVVSVIDDLCSIFRVLCGKTLHIRALELLEQKAARVFYRLEKIFLPSFFTIMVHLVIHLVYEARIGGPVHYRWMYPIERYLKTLKSYVRNKAQPEGSIAQAYLAEECLIFYDQLDHDKDNNASDLSDLFPSEGKPYGNIQGFRMDDKVWKQAHRYILFNCGNPAIETLRKDHISHITRLTRRRRPSQHEKELLHNEGFSDWLQNYVKDPENASDERITTEIKSLARGPNHTRRFHAFDVNNGYLFRTKEYKKNMSTQNSGVVVVAKTQSYASSSDTRPMLGDLAYYGRVTDMIELDYYGDFKAVLFGCEWVDVVQGRGLRRDSLGYTHVNFSHLIHTGGRVNDEPYVFPSQVSQVIYIQDCRELDWFTPTPMKPRDLYDIGEDDHHDEHHAVGAHSIADQGDMEDDIDNLPSTIVSEGIYVDDDHIEDTDEEDNN